MFISQFFFLFFLISFRYFSSSLFPSFFIFTVIVFFQFHFSIFLSFFFFFNFALLFFYLSLPLLPLVKIFCLHTIHICPSSEFLFRNSVISVGAIMRKIMRPRCKFKRMRLIPSCRFCCKLIRGTHP